MPAQDDGDRVGVFRAFRKSWFRLFWSGRSLATAGFRMHAVARDWLVYSLTGSSFWVSVVVSAWSFGTLLFSLVGGATADRVDKRKLLVLGQAGCGAVVLAMAGLVFADLIQVWHLVVSTFALAVMFSFVIPARRGVVSALTPDGLLMNAMALSTAGIGLMGIVSASLAGLLIDEVSPAAAFVVTTLLFAVAAWLYGRLPAVRTEMDRDASIRQIVTEGGQYILDRPQLLALFGLELVRVFFFQYTALLPLAAGDVYDVGGIGLGLLRAARGAGSLVGSLLTAWRGGRRNRYGLLLASGALAGLGLLFFGQAPTFALAILALSVVAVGEYVYMITRSTLLQSVRDQSMRGRTVGFRRLLWGLRPLGGLPAGAVADAIGPSRTATLEGAIILALFGVAALARRWLRRRGSTSARSS
jgi:predicted MFS family arabinose efflux permease